MNKTLKNPLVYILFLLPTILLYCLFMGVPVIQAFYYGFTDWDGLNPHIFNGLENFKEAFSDSDFWFSLLNNVYFIYFSIVIQLPIILFLALLISQVKRFKAFYKTAVFIPSILSTAVIGILWGFIYEPDSGLLNQFLALFGVEKIYWLSDKNTAMISILITNAWQWTGFYIVLILAAILGIPKDLLEQAEIDGATTWKKSTQIIIPLINPIIIVVMLLSIAGAMKALDIVWVMTEGGPFGTTDVMATYMIKEAFREYQYGYGNAIAVLIFIFTLLITGIFQWITKNKERIEY
ncbi:carbohydrate ABC transporter permease [Chengkuizengella axinellae]|uniref:Sugar ABC transporter permease n=1 Tax=Chengkuizengella axinellae TaxID=3064388 RepID=A0ABT9J219_9BACL|nr:sugar ABC transporter permease [Chengkuizengella sp. 2205SS18-9]MDP5275661.1 sugar ABC transporter permease [Chengkuizengella sp. 2205SS18-9]